MIGSPSAACMRLCSASAFASAVRWVFQDPRTGQPWHSEEAFQRVYWSKILKRLGIRYRRTYNMRHSYATSMRTAGMTPAFCARQLGHTVEMFLRTYAKWINGS